jgi:hypothetical protein
VTKVAFSTYDGPARYTGTRPARAVILSGVAGAKKALETLVQNGMEETVVLEAIAATAILERTPLYENCEWTAGTGMNKDGLLAFAGELRSDIEKISRILNNKFLDPGRLIPDTEAAFLFQLLPKILALFAAYLEDKVPSQAKQVAYLNRIRNLSTAMQVKLVQLTRDATGKPFYGDLATLLTAAFYADGQKERFIDPDALKALYSRSPHPLRVTIGSMSRSNWKTT